MREDACTEARGTIFEIQRFCIHDGPGIRTTVFLKGCPLRCAWCHNPEGMRPGSELAFEPTLCIGCGFCFRVCPSGAHRRADNGSHILERGVCAVCGSCTRECYAQALEWVGREVSVGEAMATVLRDRPFYETSGGGMTLSGGEPLAQPDFAAALLRLARAEGLHTCIETCGHAPWEVFARILPDTDLFLYDIKETDSARHAEFTGVSNVLILDNLRRLHDAGARVWLRCPIIPGCNDRADHLEAVVALARSLAGLAGVDLATYNPLGESKARRFGREPARRFDADEPYVEFVREWRGRLAAMGIPVIAG